MPEWQIPFFLMFGDKPMEGSRIHGPVIGSRGDRLQGSLSLFLLGRFLRMLTLLLLSGLTGSRGTGSFLRAVRAIRGLRGRGVRVIAAFSLAVNASQCLANVGVWRHLVYWFHRLWRRAPLPSLSRWFNDFVDYGLHWVTTSRFHLSRTKTRVTGHGS
jgi:hypothetical protein